MLSTNKLFKKSINEISVDDNLTPQNKQVAFQIGIQNKQLNDQLKQQKQERENQIFQQQKEQQQQDQAAQKAQEETDKEQVQAYKNDNLEQSQEYQNLKDSNQNDKEVKDRVDKIEKLKLKQDPRVKKLEAEHELNDELSKEKEKAYELDARSNNPEVKKLRIQNNVKEKLNKNEEDALEDYYTQQQNKKLDDIKTKTKVQDEMAQHKREKEVENKLDKLIDKKEE